MQNHTELNDGFLSQPLPNQPAFSKITTENTWYV